MTQLIQCICAFTGSLGFGILFNIRGKNLFYAAFGGFLSWMIFSLMGLFLPVDFGQYFVSAAFISLYSECMAMIRKVPVTIFLVTSMIPLVPGGVIFYTMQNLILGETRVGADMGIYAFEIAGSIAIGILLIAYIVRAIKQIARSRYPTK
ncbi:MAG: threonine/serine exporter family protein [Velocimicrobium sp.]